MVLQLLIALMAISSLSLLIPKGRRRRIWSVLILTGLGIISYFLIENLNNSPENGFIYQWLPYDVLKADFNISSSLRMQQMLVPLFCLLAAVIYLSTILSAEQHSLHFNTLLLLNFIALILLVSSHDFLQLMFACSLFSIISFYMPDLALSKKKIFIFNFLSEMSVFMALAIVYGKTETISLSSLPVFAENGWHKDLVAGLLLFAVGSKCGLFLLNGHYFNLKNILPNRMVGIMTLSVPLSGVFLSLKLQPLIAASAISAKILPTWCIFSIGAALASALVNNNLKSKFISFALAAYAFLLFGVYTEAFNIYTVLPRVLAIIFLFAVVIIIALLASSEEADVAFLGGLWHNLKINVVLSLAILMGIAAEFSSFAESRPAYYFGLVCTIVPAAVLRMVYLGKSRADEKVVAFAKNAGMLYIVPVLTFLGWLIWNETVWADQNFYVLGGTTLAVFLLFPVGWLIRIGRLHLWQGDILSRLYEIVVIRPMTILGRILWLAFDVVVIERSVIGSISSLTSVIVLRLQKVQESRWINYLLSIFVGMGLLLAYWGYCIYE